MYFNKNVLNYWTELHDMIHSGESPKTWKASPSNLGSQIMWSFIDISNLLWFSNTKMEIYSYIKVIISCHTWEDLSTLMRNWCISSSSILRFGHNKHTVKRPFGKGVYTNCVPNNWKILNMCAFWHAMFCYGSSNIIMQHWQLTEK